ncbi:hypothetical protein Echvi_2198 [Echinicola vietnamensis DSM 17526]|uniref:Uncharacterized protein n=1 Tax=Echinicola vietnamensis (strain DSM 17526 / LMG 23754 / KMM 6221) TaxID=926556 RepID=L0FZH9_ECHVK|nr:hypothetical protein Echvi_2198 [Echinicola vietnamensis DSM 17526]
MLFLFTSEGGEADVATDRRLARGRKLCYVLFFSSFFIKKKKTISF